MSFYYATDVLHFSPEFLGALSAVGYVLLMVGTLVYNSFFKHVAYRPMLLWAQLALVVISLSEILLVTRVNLVLGPCSAFRTPVPLSCRQIFWGWIAVKTVLAGPQGVRADWSRWVCFWGSFGRHSWGQASPGLSHGVVVWRGMERRPESKSTATPHCTVLHRVTPSQKLRHVPPVAPPPPPFFFSTWTRGFGREMLTAPLVPGCM